MSRGKDKRRYITIANTMPESPKIEALSDGAFRLLVILWCYCSRNENDGKLSNATWARRGTPKQRAELVAAGLVDLMNDAVLMHDYLRHQWSAAEIEEMRGKRSEAGSKGGMKSAEVRAKAKQVLEQPLEQVLKQTGSKTQAPIPIPIPLTETSNDVSAATLVAEWIDHCPKRPMGRTVGQVAKHVGEAIGAGYTTDEVRQGLAAWHRKNLNPAQLPNLIHEVVNAPNVPPKRSTRDARIAETDELFARLRAQHQIPAIGE